MKIQLNSEQVDQLSQDLRKLADEIEQHKGIQAKLKPKCEFVCDDGKCEFKCTWTFAT